MPKKTEIDLEARPEMKHWLVYWSSLAKVVIGQESSHADAYDAFRELLYLKDKLGDLSKDAPGRITWCGIHKFGRDRQILYCQQLYSELVSVHRMAHETGDKHEQNRLKAEAKSLMAALKQKANGIKLGHIAPGGSRAVIYLFTAIDRGTTGTLEERPPVRDRKVHHYRELVERAA